MTSSWKHKNSFAVRGAPLASAAAMAGRSMASGTLAAKVVNFCSVMALLRSRRLWIQTAAAFPCTGGRPGEPDSPLGQHDGRGASRAYATSPAEPFPAGAAVPIAIRRGLAASDSGKVNSNIPLS